METALLVAAVLVAGLACPAVMWWQHRRGRAAPCCPPVERSRSSSEDHPAGELAELQRRHGELAALLAELYDGPRRSRGAAARASSEDRYAADGPDNL